MIWIEGFKILIVRHCVVIMSCWKLLSTMLHFVDIFLHLHSGYETLVSNALSCCAMHLTTWFCLFLILACNATHSCVFFMYCFVFELLWRMNFPIVGLIKSLILILNRFYSLLLLEYSPERISKTNGKGEAPKSLNPKAFFPSTPLKSCFFLN